MQVRPTIISSSHFGTIAPPLPQTKTHYMMPPFDGSRHSGAPPSPRSVISTMHSPSSIDCFEKSWTADRDPKGHDFAPLPLTPLSEKKKHTDPQPNRRGNQAKYRTVRNGIQDKLREDIDASILANGDNHLTTARLYTLLGNAEFRQENHTAAVIAYEHASRCEQERPVAMLNLGTVYWRVGDIPTAMPLLQEAYDNSRDARIQASACHQMGLCHALIGDVFEAMESLRVACRLRQHVYGRRHWTVARTLDATGTVQGMYGNYEEAIGLYQQSLRLLLQDRTQTTTGTLKNIVRVCDAKGEAGKARRLITEVLKIQETSGSPWLKETKSLLRSISVCRGVQRAKTT